jgi:hypothetical protein
MKHQQARNKRAPKEIKDLKRQLGLDKQHLHPIRNFVRLEKDVGGTQSIGPDNQVSITWQVNTRNIGGGADLAGNRFVVPERRTGLWAMRVALHLSSATIDDNSNYRVVITRNGTEMAFEHNPTWTIGNTRSMTARCQDERFLDAGDVIQIQMENSTDGTQPSPNVDVIEDSHATFRFLGFVGQ